MVGNLDDGIGDCVDNCTAVLPLQIDSNSDGYGNLCDADVTNVGVVGGASLGLLRGAFLKTAPGPPNAHDIDFDSDCVIGGADLGILRKSFLLPPGPSGLGCAGTIPCPPGGGVPSPC